MDYWWHGPFVDGLSRGHLLTDHLTLLDDVHQLWPAQTPWKRVVFSSKVFMKKPLCFPTGIHATYKKSLIFFNLSSACPQTSCLHGLLGLVLFCLK